ncbi:MAG: phosphatase PAP2 family protein [bacterium]
MKKNWLSIVLSIFVLSFFSPGEPAFASEKRNIFSRFGRDFKYIFTSPLRLGKSDILPLSAILVGTCGLIALDENIRGSVQDSGSNSWDEIFSFSRQFGDGRAVLSIAGIFYLAGKIFHDEKSQDTAISALESFIFSGLMCSGLKVLTGRSRPYREEGSGKFYGPTFDNSKLSLPSGHATVAFSLASVIAAEYDSLIVDISAYTIASLTAASRVYHDKHWTSDVVLGAVIGTLVGRAVVYQNKNENIETTGISPFARVRERGFEVGFAQKF